MPRQCARFGFPERQSLHQEKNLMLRALVETQPSVNDLTSAHWFGGLGFVDGRLNFAVVASLLRRYGKAKALSDGRRLHASISRCGYDRNTFLGNCLVEMYGNCGNVKDAREVFDQMLQPNLYSWNILIKAYGQNGKLDEAASIFGRMPCRDVVSWTAIIAVLTQNGHGKEALGFFNLMLLEGVKPDKITFVCALDACATQGTLEEGQKIHAAIADGKYAGDVMLANTLINMYGKCGSISQAKSVFDKMPHRNVISWNAMIGALAQNGHGKEALSIFWHMQLDSVKPDRISFLCILEACAIISGLAEGRRIHSAIIKEGYEEDVFIGNTLVNMYAKCLSFSDAQSVLYRPHRDVVAWNAMIAAYAQNGFCKDALDLYYQMQLESVQANDVTFICVLDACSSLSALSDGQEIHNTIINNGYEQDIAIGNALINMYGKCFSVKEARSVFSRMKDKDTVTWNVILATLTQNGHDEEAMALFHQLQLIGMEPDKTTLVSALDACANLAALRKGQEIHAATLEFGYDFDLFVGNALINMYGKCGLLDEAMSLFGRMLHQDVVSWTSIIAAFAQNGHLQESLDLFSQMQLEDIKPNQITFICILNACSHTGQVEDGKHLFRSMVRDHGISPTGDHFLCMIDLLGRAGCLNEAEDLIIKMPCDKVEMAWLSLLGACKIHCDVERGVHAAHHCFELDPKNAVPYILLSNLYATAGRWNDVAKVREALNKSGVKQWAGWSYIEFNKVLDEFGVGDISHPHRYEILQTLTTLIEDTGYESDMVAVLCRGRS